MRKVLQLAFLLLCSGFVFSQGGTTSSDFYPASSGQNIGNSGQRWNIYGNNLDITGTFNCTGINCPGTMSVVNSVPASSKAGKLYLLSTGFENFLIDNGTKVWSPSGYESNVIAFGADATGATGSTTALTNAVNAVAKTSGQRLYVPPGTYLIDTPWHIARQVKIDCSWGGYDDPGTTFVLAAGAQISFDKSTISPDGGSADWSSFSGCKILGTTASCTATSGNGTLTACSNLSALNLAVDDYVVVMGMNGSLWTLNVPQGTQSLSTTSNSLTFDNSVTSGFSGPVTVMKSGFVATSGTTGNGSLTITGVANPAAFNPGDPIQGAGIPYPDFVTGRNVGAGTLTLFTAAGAAAGTGNLTKGPLASIAVHAASITLNDISMNMCAGFCYDNNGSVSYTPSVIADGQYTNRLRLTRSGDACFHSQGADSNTGTFIGTQSSYCANGGVRDDSFLGNVHIGDQTASGSGPAYSTTNANASNVLINPYCEGGQSCGVYGLQTLVLAGNATINSSGGNFITGSGTMSPTFRVLNYGESTASVTNGSATITGVTNIAHWNVGDTIVGTCLATSSVVNTTDGVGTLTLAASVGGAAKNAVCTQPTASIAHTQSYFILGTNSGLGSTSGKSYSSTGATTFSYENQYRDYYAASEWGWACDMWRAINFAQCLSTDWAVGKEVPPNAGTGSYGNNGGRVKFPVGFYIGSGAAADYFSNILGSAAPTTGSYSAGSWVWPQTPTLTGGAAFVQLGAGKSYSTTVTADTTVGSTSLANTSTNFQNTCAPNDWITGTGIENDTIIFSVNTGTTSAVLSRPATAAGTPTLTCGRLAKSHPATTGDTTSGSAAIINVSPISSFANNDMITGTGIPANTYVVSGGGTASITISQNATATNSGVVFTDPTTSWATVGFQQSQQLTTAGTAVTNGTCQAQTTMTFTGASTSTSTVSWAYSSTPVATWQTGITVLPAVTAANTVIVYLCNPTSGSITPAAATLNVRVHF